MILQDLVESVQVQKRPNAEAKETSHRDEQRIFLAKHGSPRLYRMCFLYKECVLSRVIPPPNFRFKKKGFVPHETQHAVWSKMGLCVHMQASAYPMRFSRQRFLYQRCLCRRSLRSHETPWYYRIFVKVLIGKSILEVFWIHLMVYFRISTSHT